MRSYHKEVEAIDARAKKELGSKWQAPSVSYKHPRSSNEGQKATVRGLVAGMEQAIADLRKDVMLELCDEMKIDPKGVGSLDNVIMLSTYDSVVDIMRQLPPMTSALQSLRKNVQSVMRGESEIQFARR